MSKYPICFRSVWTMLSALWWLAIAVVLFFWIVIDVVKSEKSRRKYTMQFICYKVKSTIISIMCNNDDWIKIMNIFNYSITTLELGIEMLVINYGKVNYKLFEVNYGKKLW